MKEIEMQIDVPLADKTTLKVGGNAQWFQQVNSGRELAAAVAEARERNLTIHLLSGGTNTLVKDSGVAGLVIQPRIIGQKIIEEKGEDVLVTVPAGEDWDALVAWTVGQGFWGLENLSLIPGWVGASPFQNIGAYGQEVADVIRQVKAFDIFEQKELQFSAEQCQFAYRSSFFKNLQERAGHPRYIITEVIFRLSKKPQLNCDYADVKQYFDNHNLEPTQAAVREAVVAIRTSKMPDMSQVGTAGSYFINPVVDQSTADDLTKKYPDLPQFAVSDGMVKIPLAWLLDNVLKLKGYVKNQVGLYEKHPLVVVTYPGATATAVLDLERDIKQQIERRTGIKIEREVRVLQ